MVGKNIHTNIEQTAPGQTLYNIYFYNIYFLATTPLPFSLFYNTILQVCRATLMDVRQACEDRFSE
jgi:hypothetical protein